MENNNLLPCTQLTVLCLAISNSTKRFNEKDDNEVIAIFQETFSIEENSRIVAKHLVEKKLNIQVGKPQFIGTASLKTKTKTTKVIYIYVIFFNSLDKPPVLPAIDTGEYFDAALFNNQPYIPIIADHALRNLPIDLMVRLNENNEVIYCLSNITKTMLPYITATKKETNYASDMSQIIHSSTTRKG